MHVISVLFLLCFRARRFIDVLSPAGKGLTSWLSFVMSNCHFPIGILGQVWCLIVSIPDLCPFSYFENKENIRGSGPVLLKNPIFLRFYMDDQDDASFPLWIRA